MSILRLIVNIRLALFLPMKSCVTGLYVSNEHYSRLKKVDPISNAFRMKRNCAKKKMYVTELNFALCFEIHKQSENFGCFRVGIVNAFHMLKHWNKLGSAHKTATLPQYSIISTHIHTFYLVLYICWKYADALLLWGLLLMFHLHSQT